MDRKPLSTWKINRMLANILGILVILAIALPGSAGVSAQESSAYIVASITFNWFRAVNFAPDASLDIQIYESNQGELLWNESRTTDGSGYVHVGEWEHPVNIRPGTYIVISDGSTTKELELEAVTLDSFDIGADVLSGTAPAGRSVWAGAGKDSAGCSMDLVADPISGAWTADFTTQEPPCDLVDGMWAAAQIFDGDGDASEANPLPDPHFVIFPEWQWYDGLNWPDDATVSITVAEKDACTTSGVSNRYFFNGGFPEGCNVETGDTVTFNDGITTRTHTVIDLKVGAVDLETDSVTGTTYAGATVYVWAHANGEQVTATADEGGNWSAYLGDVIDLLPGEEGRSQIFDDEGNATAVDWRVANPWMIAFPENNAVEGWEWPEGAMVYLTVNGMGGEGWNGTAQVTTWGDPRTYFRIELGDEYDLKAGDQVTLTYGETSRTHVVQELSVTGVDPFADTVSGNAAPEASLQVWPHGYDQDATLDINADQNGNWVADFSGVFELHSDTEGRSWIVDDAGSATAVDWQVDLAYDIYVFDTWTGSIQQVTTTDMDEYNPSWSPNGKKIAHDGVSAEGHGIFITDVRNGVTSPLEGAQDGGNDAAWSPNGKWIVFDRRWYGDPNVYLVPSGGGEAMLAVPEAVAADWAPNGKRLVFERGDGSLETAPADGGKGSGTSLGVNGVAPAWSPDGNWIAYSFEGDVWKLPVNVQGRALGEPVQLTSGVLIDEHPTWSADGTTIIFQSGLGDDFDLWSVPAAGGERSWLNGAAEFGDYDPDASPDGRYVAYASFSGEGQAPRHWVAALTADAGTWIEGEHSFYFDVQYTSPEPGTWASEPKSFTVGADVPLYDGKVSIRTLSMRDRTEDGCQFLDWALNPQQDTMFQFGWVSDSPLFYSGALEHFASLTAAAHWDDAFSAPFTVHEVIPWTDGLDWEQYSCSFTPQ